MNLATLLTSETALTVVAAVIGALWAAFKGSEWYARLRLRRGQQALRALEAAVEQTYREYVRALKAARGAGKLTLEEQAEARRHARTRAVVIASEQGIDLARELGADQMDLWIAKLVKRLKRP